jgi:hypothetical protein
MLPETRSTARIWLKNNLRWIVTKRMGTSLKMLDVAIEASAGTPRPRH